MARYIDADELNEFLWDAKDTTEDKEKQAMYRAFVGIVNASPTADVQEVRHGHWIELINSSYSPFDGTSEYIYICSECGRKEGKREVYCHCGAKMDEVVEEDE